MSYINETEIKYLINKINSLIKKTRHHDCDIISLNDKTESTCDLLDYIVLKVKMLDDFVTNISGKWFVRDVKDISVNGGSNIIGAWTVRPLNTVITNNVNPANNNLVKLDNNDMVFSPGIYYIKIRTVFTNTGATRIRLFDVTNNKICAISLSQYVVASNNSYISVPIELETVVTVNTSNTHIRLDYFTDNQVQNIGLGLASGITGSDEVYTDITIEKVG